MAWKNLPSMDKAFKVLSDSPTSEEALDVLPLIERFVVVLYERCSEEEEVDKARKVLFIKGRDIENIPPTRDALRFHVLRAAFQGGHVWRKSLLKNPELPDPTNFGWKKLETGWIVRNVTEKFSCL